MLVSSHFPHFTDTQLSADIFHEPGSQTQLYAVYCWKYMILIKNYIMYFVFIGVILNGRKGKMLHRKL